MPTAAEPAIEPLLQKRAWAARAMRPKTSKLIGQPGAANGGRSQAHRILVSRTDHRGWQRAEHPDDEIDAGIARSDLPRSLRETARRSAAAVSVNKMALAAPSASPQEPGTGPDPQPGHDQRTTLTRRGANRVRSLGGRPHHRQPLDCAGDARRASQPLQNPRRAPPALARWTRSTPLSPLHSTTSRLK